MKTVYMRQSYLDTVGDTKNLEIHFAEMAMKGWLIDKVSLWGHRYRSAQPCKKRFFVDFLPQITTFDYSENEDAQDYRRICEESGWTFVTAHRQLNIFCTDEGAAEPIPIHTDNKIQAEIHLSMCRKYELFHLIFLLLVVGYAVLSPLAHGGTEIFLSDILTFGLLGFFLFLIGYVWHLGFVVLWYRQTKKSAEFDLPLPVVNYRLAKIRRKVFAASTLAFFLFAVTGAIFEILNGLPIAFLLLILSPLLCLGIGHWVKHQIATKPRNRETNFAITLAAIAIAQVVILNFLTFGILESLPNRDMYTDIGDRPALTLHSLGISQEPEYTSLRIRGSLMVPIHYSYWETNGQGSVRTEVYHPIHYLVSRELYNRFARRFQERYIAGGLRETESEISVLSANEAAFWGADEGIIAIRRNLESHEPYLHYSNLIQLVLLKGNTILRLSIFGENIEKETVANAVRGLLT